MGSVIAARTTCCSAEQFGFVPVAIDTLTPSQELPFDLFLRSNADTPPVLYRERHLAVDQEDLSRLTSQAVQTLYIRGSEHVAYRNYLRDTVLRNMDLPATRRFKIIKIANQAILQLAFQRRNSDMLVNFAGEYGRELASVVCDDDLVVTDLLSLMTHDYQTYTHATNVCTLSLMIAAGMGFTPGDGIVELAAAVLLHDIGKRKIAPAILNQRRPFTPEQRDLIRKHPTWGFQELCHREDLDERQLMVVYQHHEHWDGRGYPVGLVGEEIHLWARICTVANAYDTMSSVRPPRPAKTPHQVWEVLELGCDRKFDREIVKCLKSLAGPPK